MIELFRGSHSVTETNLHMQITPAFRRDVFEDHRDLFRDKLYGDKFWSGGYFARTVGAVNAETVKKYVAESQEYKVEIKARQRTLIQF